jgi:hypothetical protein
MAGTPQQRSWVKPALALLLAGSLLLQTGCASLAEIRDFAAMAKQASESFPPMMEDMEDSFIRTRQMDNLSRGLPLEDATKKAQDDCDQSAFCKNIPDFIGAGKVMENYMRVMGQLAVDDLASFDKSVQAFSDQIKTSAGIQDNQRDAIKSLTTFLVNAAANGYRRRKLAETLIQHNEDIRTLTGALMQIVGDYERQLSTEDLAMQSYFEGAIREHRSAEPISKILVYNLYDRDRQELRKRQNAAGAYMQFLQTVQTAHDGLSKKASKLDAADVRGLMEGFATDINGQIQVIRKAF